MTQPRTDDVPGWVSRLAAELDAADARATALAKPLTIDQLNWTPAPGSWSVGQCLDHLTVTNRAYVAAMAEALEGRDPAPVAEITPGWFGRWFIESYIEPSPRTKRVKAPPRMRPAPRVDAAALQRFVESNRAVRGLVRRAAPYDVNRIRFRNPFVPLVRFTVGTGLEILTRHERRHLLQAERVRQTPGFPG